MLIYNVDILVRMNLSCILFQLSYFHKACLIEIPVKYNIFIHVCDPNMPIGFSRWRYQLGGMRCIVLISHYRQPYRIHYNACVKVMGTKWCVGRTVIILSRLVYSVAWCLEGQAPYSISMRSPPFCEPPTNPWSLV